MEETVIYPYLVQPKEVEAIWGGDALAVHYGKAADPHSKTGESWECWDENVILNGSLQGMTIAQLRRRLGPLLLGDLDPTHIFPVLTKIIDARASLSVQVHPDDAYAQSVEHQENGKTECWYILEAQPGAELILGWTRDTSREEYVRRVTDGSLAEILRRVPVQPGDAFYLPAGTLHAIGAGIVLFETQQASDLTYRIFDWNRVDAEGQPRALHIQKAADVLNWKRCTAGAVAKLPYECEGLARTALIADPRFVVERIALQSQVGYVSTDGRPLILMALETAAQLEANDGRCALAPYQTAILPAQAGRVGIRGNAELLAVQAAGAEALEKRLQSSGVDAEVRAQFMAQFNAAPTMETSQP